MLGLASGIAGLVGALGQPAVAAAIAIGAVATMVIAYSRELKSQKDATSAVAALATIAIGFLAGSGSAGLAIACAAIAVALLAMRSELHGFVDKLEAEDVKALARYAVIAGAVLPFLPSGDVSTETWLAIGLAVALAGVLALAVAVLALAREVGLLRLAVGSQGALEVPDEGPPLGEPTPLAERFATTAQTRLALAVFASEGCALCTAVAPSVELLAREPWLAVETFDEARHADAWAAASVPGSPYAVALDPLTGVVLAKGTFNGLAQLIVQADKRGGPIVIEAVEDAPFGVPLAPAKLLVRAQKARLRPAVPMV